MKLRMIPILLASIQLFQPSASVAMHSDNSYKTAAQLGFIGTSLGVLGTYLGIKYYQDQQPAKKIAEKADKKLPKHVRSLIGSFLKEDNTLSHEEKLIFLPAILPINKKIVDTAMQKTIDENKKRVAALKEKEFEALQDLLAGLQGNSKEPVSIALYAEILSTRRDQNTRELDLIEKQNKNISERLYIKGKTSLHTLLGEPLFPGEIAFIGYSDGSVEIVLTETDTQSLRGLSDKERAILRKLYSPRIDHGLMMYTKVVTQREWSEFKQVFTDEQKRTCVRRFYNLQVEGIILPPDWKIAVFVTAATVMFFGIVGAVKLGREARYHRLFPHYYNSAPSCTWFDLPPFILFKILKSKLSR